jgi:hypothetical protein
MERLGLVVYGLLQHISPKLIGVARGAQRQQPVYTGIVVNNFISFHLSVPRLAPYRAKPDTATCLPSPTAWR